MKSLQLDKPHAIVVIGIQGSGKTFFAEKFAETFNAPFLNQAVFHSHGKSAALAETLQNTMIDELLKTGRSIVMEQSLSSKNERLELIQRLKKHGYAPLFVWVQVDNDAAMTRAYRSSGIKDEEYRARSRKFSPPHASEHAVVISGKHTFATQAKAVLRRLSQPRTLQQSPQGPIRPQPTRGQIIVR